MYYDHAQRNSCPTGLMLGAIQVGREGETMCKAGRFGGPPVRLVVSVRNRFTAPSTKKLARWLGRGTDMREGHVAIGIPPKIWPLGVDQRAFLKRRSDLRFFSKW